MLIINNTKVCLARAQYLANHYIYNYLPKNTNQYLPNEPTQPTTIYYMRVLIICTTTTDDGDDDTDDVTLLRIILVLLLST